MLAPVSSHTTTRTQQPATSFKGQPEGGQGILETDRQAPGRQSAWQLQNHQGNLYPWIGTAVAPVGEQAVMAWDERRALEARLL